MKGFPPNLKFQYPWRPYQTRILSELNQYLDDSRLHIVAAPGSGKTIVGLEVMLRLNRPTLILAPTIAIKNQWIDRLVSNFIPDQQKPFWISDNIKEPQFLTVSTYQGLYSALHGIQEEFDELEEEKDEIKTKRSSTSKVDVLALLKKQKIDTLIVDEAHHLRNNWWTSLQKMIKYLGPTRIVALTATPPYDVPPLEWDRYIGMCGPVDTQVSVPELVKEKNLCYHQDYILFSTPTREESEEIIRFRDRIWQFFEQINSEGNLSRYLINHPWIMNPTSNIENILENPSLFSSMLVYLHSIGKSIPSKTIRIITSKSKNLPELSLAWMEILLTGLLFSNSLEDLPEFLINIHNQLKELGAIERKKVDLEGAEDIEKILKQSLSKLKSILEIVALESAYLGNSLRMVILTDYIKKEYLPKESSDEISINKIGVVPIFEKIRKNKNSDLKLGVLTGSIIIIPKISQYLLNQILEADDINLDRMTITELNHDKNFLKIKFMGAEKKKRVEIITKLFTAGGVNVLVGTKSLLGEGWDAPSINSLILATFVGSYMLSNQMRGRAIRKDPDKLSKTANIWHLVCLDLPSLKERVGIQLENENSGGDYQILKRRFKGFLGVAFDEPVIKNGLERVNITKAPKTKNEIKKYNGETKNHAINRDDMANDWRKALELNKNYRLTSGVRSRAINLPRSYVFLNTIAAILWQGLMAALFFFAMYLRGLSRIRLEGDLDFLFILILVGIITGSLIFLPYFLKACWLFIRHGPIKGSLKQVASALIHSLYNSNKIYTPPKEIRIITEKDDYYAGAVNCRIENCTKREESIFLDTLEELLNPIGNPRYLLKRKSILGNLIKRQDYLAVPEILGTNKEFAIEFSKNWEKYVGKMELIYTRTLEGRKILLKARTKSLSSAFVEKADRISTWD